MPLFRPNLPRLACQSGTRCWTVVAVWACSCCCHCWLAQGIRNRLTANVETCIMLILATLPASPVFDAALRVESLQLGHYPALPSGRQ